MEHHGLSCGAQCLRILMFVFNFIFFALGLLLLGLGADSRVQAKDYDSVLGDDGTVASAGNLLIASGVLVAIIGFVGCCGAWKKTIVLLGIFAALVILIFIVEIAGGVLAYTKKDEVTQHMVKALDHIVSTNYVTDKPSVAQKAAVKSLDWFQKELKCCGTTGPSSWANSTWYKSHNKTLEQVPESCCQSTPCERTYEPASSSIFDQGCIVQ